MNLSVIGQKLDRNPYPAFMLMTSQLKNIDSVKFLVITGDRLTPLKETKKWLGWLSSAYLSPWIHPCTMAGYGIVDFMQTTGKHVMEKIKSTKITHMHCSIAPASTYTRISKACETDLTRSMIVYICVHANPVIKGQGSSHSDYARAI